LRVRAFTEDGSIVAIVVTIGPESDNNIDPTNDCLFKKAGTVSNYFG
jgi:hypothetical protein